MHIWTHFNCNRRNRTSFSCQIVFRKSSEWGDGNGDWRWWAPNIRFYKTRRTLNIKAYYHDYSDAPNHLSVSVSSLLFSLSLYLFSPQHKQTPPVKGGPSAGSLEVTARMRTLPGPPRWRWEGVRRLPAGHDPGALHCSLLPFACSGPCSDASTACESPSTF